MNLVNTSQPVKPMQSPIAERVLDAFPSGSYALAALLRLMDIVESAAVPTAAVECQVQPRLLVNPEFVDRHAPTSEKLMMLVMHELHHVLLGHTTLFPRVTPAQNFVFDAVINGLVCRMFPEPQCSSFFTDFYRDDVFPECLLRPPPGWPLVTQTAPGIARLAEPLRTRAAEVHSALYSPAGASYGEVFELLPTLLVAEALGGIPLLGGHDPEGERDAQSLQARSPLMFEVVRGIVEHWPQPPDPIRGRSLADVLRDAQVKPTRPPSARAVLRRLIRRISGERGTAALRRIGLKRSETSTPIPSLARRSLVQRSLGVEPLLHPGEVLLHRPRCAGERVHVYLDVSGSMGHLKAPLYGALLDCADLVHPSVHLFSTQVADVSLEELRRGVCRSTGGTSIACVAEHAASHRVRRALLITDGYVGPPRGSHHDTLSRLRLGVAWVGANINRTDLAQVTDFSDQLPIGGHHE